MDIGIISVRYARALLRFAEANGEEVAVYHEMESMSRSFREVRAMQSMLLNPVLADSRIVELLLAACKISERTVTKSSHRFIKLVTEHRRADLMQFIANSYVTLYRKKKNVIKGNLIVPSEISESVSQKLRTIVEERSQAETVEFEVHVDESIQGGFILEYDTYRLDASLRSQLSKLHRSLKN